MNLNFAIEGTCRHDSSLEGRPLNIVPTVLRGGQTKHALFAASRCAILSVLIVVWHITNGLHRVKVPQDRPIVFATSFSPTNMPATQQQCEQDCPLPRSLNPQDETRKIHKDEKQVCVRTTLRGVRRGDTMRYSKYPDCVHPTTWPGAYWLMLANPRV